MLQYVRTVLYSIVCRVMWRDQHDPAPAGSVLKNLAALSLEPSLPAACMQQPERDMTSGYILFEKNLPYCGTRDRYTVMCYGG